MNDDLPTQARAVIIGGGVVGCSVAYHLAKLGWRDVVLLERKQLTCGTTWHAAGLIGQLRATANMTKLAKYSAELYAGLEAETGVATGFKQNGSVSVALTGERLEELKRGASMAKTFGLAVEVLTPRDVAAKYPLLNLDGVTGGVFLPKDGQADPANIAHAMAKGARQNGVRIFEQTKVTGIAKKDGRVTGVTTDRGDIAAEYVVNCAGMWGREVGRLAGVAVPLQACEHFYVVTEEIPGLPRDLPVLRVADECAYVKEDAGKILLGAFEPVAKPWGLDGIPEDFCFDQLPEDFDHFAPVLEAAVKRLPILETAGIHTFFNGPESFTPDDRYLLGEAPELDNFYVAAGFNSVGIQSAGGAGKALAEWMDGGGPPFDLWDVDIRRLQPFQNTRSYLFQRATESLGLLYADHFPYRQFATARGVRHSPLHERLAGRGACFGEAAGWERANWFLPEEAQGSKGSRGEAADYRYSWGRQNWFDHAAEEHRAVREGVGLFDLTSFAKIRVEGRDAEAVLQRVCANDVAVAPGRIVYTQWLNERGGIEADLTVTRLSETAFLVVTGAAVGRRDMTWLRRHIPDDAHCVATEVTAGEAVLAVMGPRSRELLARVSGADLSNAAFPFATAREIEIGCAVARAHRISYVGELGWELYVGADMARHAFDVLAEAGEGVGATSPTVMLGLDPSIQGGRSGGGDPRVTPAGDERRGREGEGLRLCGLHALDSCRLEKAFRHFGHDISDEDHVEEAGLGFAVKADKPAGRYGDFIGRRAVLDKRGEGLTRRLVQFRLADPGPLLYHNEPIWRDGRIAGHLTSGAYGHHLGAAVGLGYVACEPGESARDVEGSAYEIEVAGERVAAEASLRPMYDPRGERVRG